MAQKNSLPIGPVPIVDVGAIFFPEISGPTIAQACPEIIRLEYEWRTVDALWEGTRAMRLCRDLYLPKEEAETESNYERRLKRSTLYNGYRSSIQNAVARIYSQDVNIHTNNPAMKAFETDVDGQGQNLTQFTKQGAERAINHGVSYILVDQNRLPRDFANLAEQEAAGVRPYWVNIPATSVLEARSATFSGGERLALFRYVETVVEMSADGLGSQSYEQVRVFKQGPAKLGNPLLGTEDTPEGPVMFAVYRQQEYGDQWTLIDSGELKGIPYIPVIPDYSNRVGFFLGKPLLMDLADLNIQHWQASSDHSNIVHVATVPFLFTKGLKAQFDENGNAKSFQLNVHAGVVAADKDADIKWVEHTGASINSSAQFLKELEIKMEKLGLQISAPLPGGNITATQHSISAAETNSMLKSFALAHQDTINACLYLTELYLNSKPGEARATVNTDYAVDYANDQTMTAVNDMYRFGIIDKETAIAEGKRRNVLDPLANIAPATDVHPATISTGGAPANASGGLNSLEQNKESVNDQ